MMNRLGAAVIALAAVAALYFLVLDPGTHNDLESGGVADGVEEIGGSLSGTETGDTAQGAAKGPVLFTTGKKRFGIGSLRGQLKHFESGKPAADLQVKLAGRGRKGEALDRELTTDAHGVFSATDVAAADDLLLLVARGTSQERTLPAVVVEPDAVTDLGVVWLGQGGLLEGRVIDVDGEPIVDAQVQVHEGLGSGLEIISKMLDLFKRLDQPPTSDHESKTDQDGAFAIANVPPGSIIVVARAAGYGPGASSLFKSAKGDRVEITLAPGIPVSGVVVDTDGRPVGDARVVMLHNKNMQTGFHTRALATTDGLGNFELLAPPGGADNVGVMVAAQNYPPSLFDIKSVRQPQRFVLHGGAELALRVIAEETRKPLANAEVLIFVGGKKNLTKEPKTFISAVTDENGQARCYVRPGFIQMMFVKHPSVGHQMHMGAIGMGMGGGIQFGDAKIKPGANQRTIEVKLGTRFHGVVKSSEGVPIAGARVRTQGGIGLGADTLSDAQGRYECRLSPMLMMGSGLIATAPGWIQDMEAMASQRRTASAPDLQAGEVEFDLVMKRAASITGRILAPDGTPLSGVRVRAAADQGGGMTYMRLFSAGAETVTTAKGRFLLDGVPADAKAMRIKARHKDYIDTQSEPFDMADSGTTTAADLTMKSGLRVVVAVTDMRGDAVGRAGLQINVDPSDNVNFEPMRGFVGTAGEDHRTTNAAGKVTLTAVPPGTLTVTASARGYALSRARLELTADAKKPYTLDLTMRDAAKVKGRVLGEQGRPIAGVSVDSVGRWDNDDRNWVPVVRAETRTDGTFLLEGLPDVPLTLEVGKQGFLDARVEVIGANRETVEVTLRKRDATVEREIEKVQAQLQVIYGKYGSAKGEEQRQLLKDMQRLQQKLQRLKGESVEEVIPDEAVAPAAEEGGG